MKLLNFWIPEAIYHDIEASIKAGFYPNVSEFVRHACINQIRTDKRELQTSLASLLEVRKLLTNHHQQQEAIRLLRETRESRAEEGV